MATEMKTATAVATMETPGTPSVRSAAVSFGDLSSIDATHEAAEAALDRVALLLPAAAHPARSDPLEYALAYVEQYPDDVLQLEREWDFLRSALDLAYRRGRHAAALRIAAALAHPAGRAQATDGERALRVGIEAARQIGDRRRLGLLLNRLGGLRFAHGHYQQGWRLWRVGLELDRGSPGWQPRWWAPRVSFATCVDLLGRFGATQQIVDALGVDNCDDDEQLAVVLFVRGFQAHRRGHRDQAFDDISAALRLCARHPRGLAMESWHVLSLTMQTELARLHGDHARAREVAGTAIALARVAGDAYTWAALITDQALYAYYEGSREESYDLLRSFDGGLPGAESLPLVERGRRFLALYLDDPAPLCPAPAPAHASPPLALPATLAGSGCLPRLSPRETEVLRLVAAGHTTPAIAARLVVTPATVKKHLEHVYTRLDAHSRTAAVATARALGLLA